MPTFPYVESKDLDIKHKRGLWKHASKPESKQELVSTDFRNLLIGHSKSLKLFSSRLWELCNWHYFSLTWNSIWGSFAFHFFHPPKGTIHMFWRQQNTCLIAGPFLKYLFLLKNVLRAGREMTCNEKLPLDSTGKNPLCHKVPCFTMRLLVLLAQNVCVVIQTVAETWNVKTSTFIFCSWSRQGTVKTETGTVSFCGVAINIFIKSQS